MREQVCKYMCPYARFQSAMFDKDTLVITYDRASGEPRGKGAGKGDCIDCSICVQVCPTGIDIRNGLQYECIGCAACIDGCDQVMEKIGRPKKLIRYSTTHAMEGRPTRIFRPRVLVYSAILALIAVAAAASLYLRVPLKVDVIRDRAAIAREVEGGLIENVYRLQIMNTTEQARAFDINVTGLPGILVGARTSPASRPPRRAWCRSACAWTPPRPRALTRSSSPCARRRGSRCARRSLHRAMRIGAVFLVRCSPPLPIGYCDQPKKAST